MLNYVSFRVYFYLFRSSINLSNPPLVSCFIIWLFFNTHIELPILISISATCINSLCWVSSFTEDELVNSPYSIKINKFRWYILVIFTSRWGHPLHDKKIKKFRQSRNRARKAMHQVKSQFQSTQEMKSMDILMTQVSNKRKHELASILTSKNKHR